MITGAVTGNNDPMVQIMLRDAQGQEQPVNFVIDTGFTGFLALPEKWIRRLGLQTTGLDNVILADGRKIDSPLYEVIVIWDGRERRIEANTLNDDPIIGTAMLFDYRLTIDFLNGGMVSIVHLLGQEAG